MSPRRFRLLLAVLISLFVAVGLYTHGGQDDTYITYWAAYALGETGRIVNYSGQVVEQSSSLGLVLVLGFLHAITRLSVPVLGYIVSLACFVGTLCLVERLAARLTSPRVSAAFALLAGTVPAFSYWSTSGMETAFVTLTSLATVLVLSQIAHGELSSWRRRLCVAALLFAYASARPETPLLALGLIGVTAALTALSGWKSLKSAAFPLFLAASGVLLLVLGRYLIFGRLAPLPALLKRHGFDTPAGVRYLLDAALSHEPVFFAAVLPALLCALALLLLQTSRALPLTSKRYRLLEQKLRGRFDALFPLRAPRDAVFVLIVALGTAQLLFIVLSGGDWMRGARFFAPAVPVLTLIFAGLVGSIGRRQIYLLTSVLLGAHALAHFQFLRSGSSEGRLASTVLPIVKKIRTRAGDDFSFIELTNKVHARDAVTAVRLREIVGRAHLHLGRPVTILSGQAGMVAYHTFTEHYPNARFYDLWNITNNELLLCLGKAPFQPSILGTAHDLNQVFDLLAKNHEKCGMPDLPDIYFNEYLATAHRRAFEPHGYVVVYNQTGPVRNAKKEAWIPSHNISDGHIVMRRELARALGLEPIHRPWVWDLNP